MDVREGKGVGIRARECIIRGYAGEGKEAQKLVFFIFNVLLFGCVAPVLVVE